MSPLFHPPHLHSILITCAHLSWVRPGRPLALMSQEDVRVDQGSHFLPRLLSSFLRCPFWPQDAFVVLTGLRSNLSYL